MSGRMFERAREIAQAMPEAEQVELIDAHPRLGAAPASVSAPSFAEQGYGAGSAPPGDAVAAELAELNDAYEARFGFRYCVFVSGRPRAELLPGFRAALAAPRDAELRRAIDAVVDIAADRHRTLTEDHRGRAGR
jgi:2-oxo-4-hydroxy-4-carboxy-5-ureidoimidazoline decarboxylase